MSAFRWVEQVSGGCDSAVITTPLGKFRLLAAADVLIGCNWATDNMPLRNPESMLLNALLAQLRCYWGNPAKVRFSVPLLRQGSAFSRLVWEALYDIPCGETRSYGEIAKQLHTAPRAIGAACRNNPFTLLIPCHRVVAHSGIGGYSGERAGALTEIKRRLLAHEGYL
jgi:methylated-DNA-[protein]-cysteine S-methyltransferase